VKRHTANAIKMEKLIKSVHMVPQKTLARCSALCTGEETNVSTSAGRRQEAARDRNAFRYKSCMPC